MRSEEDRRAGEEYARLYARHQREIFGYVLTLVANLTDAEEVMQEVAAALWKKFDEYDRSVPFVPWARKFAHFELLMHRRRSKRRFAFLTDEIVETLAKEESETGGRAYAERQALDGCMEKLPAKDRDLVRQRYYESETMSGAATKEKRSVHMMYKSLVRNRRQILDCIRRMLNLQGEA